MNQNKLPLTQRICYAPLGALLWLLSKLPFCVLYAVADFIAFSAPEAIVMFGGLTKSGHWILDPVVKAMNDNVLPLWRGKVQVLFSDLKEADAAVLGASALAWGD